MVGLTLGHMGEKLERPRRTLLQTSRLKQRVPAARPAVTVMTEVFFCVAAKHLAFVAADGAFYY